MPRKSRTTTRTPVSDATRAAALNRAGGNPNLVATPDGSVLVLNNELTARRAARRPGNYRLAA